MKTIKYIGFYNQVNNNNERVQNLSASNKMNYIAQKLVDIGYLVEIVSTAWIANESNKQKADSERVTLNKNIEIKYFSDRKTKYFNSVHKIILIIKFMFYLLFNTQRSETVIVYHSPILMIPIYLIKKIKNLKLILEIEEVYGTIWDINPFLSKIEKNMISKADGYILVSELLKESIDTSDKPHIYLYGTYKSHDLISKNIKKDTACIKLVYAGGIEKTKAGAFNSLKIVKYLPENYQLYILGYGSKKDLTELKYQIERSNQALGREAIFYKGVLHGSEYSEFLRKMDIALNPQNPGQYMETAFPSKLISYMEHDLTVVSTSLKTISSSEFKNYIYQVDEFSPKAFAQKILEVKLNEKNKNQKFIDDLDKKFTYQLKDLLFNIKKDRSA